MLESLQEIIKEAYMNFCEEGTHKYKKINDKDILDMANRILENEDFWGMIESFVCEELMKYEK